MRESTVPSRVMVVGPGETVEEKDPSDRDVIPAVAVVVAVVVAQPLEPEASKVKVVVARVATTTRTAATGSIPAAEASIAAHR